MRITLDTSALVRELFKLQGIVSSKSSLPILANAHIEATEDGMLRLYATDLDTSVLTEVACEVETPGRITVRARDLYDAARNLKSDRVTLHREDNHGVMLRSGTVRARLIGVDPAEYPVLLKAEGTTFLSLRTTSFIRMIDRTLFSVSTDEGRPNLTGALTRMTDQGVLVMVSTDGHRLSKSESRVEASPDTVPRPLRDGIIIPRKGLSELRRTVDLALSAVELGITNNTVVFRYGTTTLFVRLIDGTFPNFSQVIPSESDERKAFVNRAIFLDRLKMVSLFASPKTHNLRLALEDGSCTITAHDPDKGECEEKVDVRYSGPAVRAGYNYKYLLDVFTTVDGDEVSVEVTDTLSPTIIRELEGEDGDESLFIVMPMRL